MLYEEIRIKQGLSYISFSLLRILYNSKFILKAISLVTNSVVVTRVPCINKSILSPDDVSKGCYRYEVNSVDSDQTPPFLIWV